MTAAPTVFLVDDDDGLREGLTQLFESAGYQVRSCASAEAMLGAFDPQAHGCVVLDVALPGLQGPEVQRELARLGSHLPILFLTASADVPMAVQAIRAGAHDVLLKPARPEVLLARVAELVAADVAFVGRREELRTLRNKLSAREREVLLLLAEGLPHKDVGERLGISFRTVEVHRSHIIQKTGLATTLAMAEFVRAALAAKLRL